MTSTSAKQPHCFLDNWQDWDFPTPENVEEQLKKEWPEEERAEAWNNAAKAVKTYQDELFEQWQKAMDSLLTYAGLFSAVLTTFNAQSYQLLQAAPTDPMLAILATLQQVPAQLNSFSINPSFINSTQPASAPNQLQPPFRAPVPAVWINTLWFSSLVCSLASASIALMVKQWLYEASQGLSGTSRETARRRQYRLDNLIKWKVGTIVLIPSVLLQVALFLFLAGLLTLLWTIHETVATMITVLVGVLFVFVVGVTVLPIFRSDCPYRSPQAFGLFVLARPFWHTVGRYAVGTLVLLLLSCLSLLPILCMALLQLGVRLFGVPWGGGRVHQLFKHSDYMLGLFYFRAISLLSSSPIPTWNGTEQTEIARDNGVLDSHIATTAYTTTFATEHLEKLHLLLADLQADHVFSCFSDIRRSWSQLVGADNAIENSRLPVARILCGKAFYCALRKALAVDPSSRRVGQDWAHFCTSRWMCGSWGIPGPDLLPSHYHLSTLALMTMVDSESDIAMEQAQYLISSLHTASFAGGGPFSVITYDELRSVLAMGKYHVETLLSRIQVGYNEDASRVIKHKLWLVKASWHCLENTVTDNSFLTSEQEKFICDEASRLLSSFSKALATVMATDYLPQPEASLDACFQADLDWISERIEDLVSFHWNTVPSSWRYKVSLVVLEELLATCEIHSHNVKNLQWRRICRRLQYDIYMRRGEPKHCIRAQQLAAMTF